jgi:hypothetical protein
VRRSAQSVFNCTNEETKKSRCLFEIRRSLKAIGRGGTTLDYFFDCYELDVIREGDGWSYCR